MLQGLEQGMKTPFSLKLLILVVFLFLALCFRGYCVSFGYRLNLDRFSFSRI